MLNFTNRKTLKVKKFQPSTISGSRNPIVGGTFLPFKNYPMNVLLSLVEF